MDHIHEGSHIEDVERPASGEGGNFAVACTWPENVASTAHRRNSCVVAGRLVAEDSGADHGAQVGGSLQRCRSSSVGATVEGRSLRQDLASQLGLAVRTRGKTDALTREVVEAVDGDHALAGMARVHDGDGRQGGGEPTAREALEAARREDDDKTAAQDGEGLVLAGGVWC